MKKKQQQGSKAEKTDLLIFNPKISITADFII